MERASALDKHYIPGRYSDIFDEGAPLTTTPMETLRG